MGFEASKVARREGEKTPDFRCTDSKNTYLIELKSKESSKDRWKKIEDALQSNEVAEHTSAIDRINTISGIIANACEQLESEAQDEELRIVWLHASGISESAQAAQFCATIYGTVSLVELPELKGEKTEPEPYTCFFFNDSDFFRRKATLDGVVISTSEGYQLHINPYSPRADQHRRSKFRRRVPYFDISEHESKRRPLIADTDVDRRERAKVLAYLREKYDLRPLSVMTDYHYQSYFAA